MDNFVATDETRAQALAELIYGTSVSKFAQKHGLRADDVQEYISFEAALTKPIGITLAIKIGLPVLYFESAVPYVFLRSQRPQHDKIVTKSQYKPTEMKRLAVLKELIAAAPKEEIKRSIEATWLVIEKYLSGALKLDKNHGRKLALKLGLSINYFDVTPPAGDYLPEVPHARIARSHLKIPKLQSTRPKTHTDLLYEVAKGGYRATEESRLAVLKEIIGSQSIDEFAEEYDLNVNGLNRYLRSELKLDKIQGHRLALKLGLAPSYFEVTPPSSS